MPANTNAILIKFKVEDEGTKFVDYLAANNFIVNHGNGNTLVGLNKSFVRISIGTQEHIKKFKKIILLFNPTE